MKIYQSMWIQWPFLQKTWTKGHWPLDDLWPHIWWGHMCDSTQGSLCPSSMGIHQCMWIQWSILQITTYMHILRTTYHIQNEWSHLFLNYVQAKQKCPSYVTRGGQYKRKNERKNSNLEGEKLYFQARAKLSLPLPPSPHRLTPSLLLLHTYTILKTIVTITIRYYFWWNSYIQSIYFNEKNYYLS